MFSNVLANDASIEQNQLPFVKVVQFSISWSNWIHQTFSHAQCLYCWYFCFPTVTLWKKALYSSLSVILFWLFDGCDHSTAQGRWKVHCVENNTMIILSSWICWTTCDLLELPKNKVRNLFLFPHFFITKSWSWTQAKNPAVLVIHSDSQWNPIRELCNHSQKAPDDLRTVLCLSWHKSAEIWLILSLWCQIVGILQQHFKS